MTDFAKYWQVRRSSRDAREAERFRTPPGQAGRCPFRARRLNDPLAPTALAVPPATTSLFEVPAFGESSTGTPILWVFGRPDDQRLFALKSFGSFLEESTLLLRLVDGARTSARCVFPVELPAVMPASSEDASCRLARSGQRPTGRAARVREALAALTAPVPQPSSPATGEGLVMARQLVPAHEDAGDRAQRQPPTREPSLSERMANAVPARVDRLTSRTRFAVTARRRRRSPRAEVPAAPPSPSGSKAGFGPASLMAETILGALPQAAMLFSVEDGALLRSNPAAENLLGVPLPPAALNLGGLRLCEIEGEEFTPARHPLARALAGEAVVAEEVGLRLGDRSVVPIELCVRRVDLAGESALLLTASDISSRKLQERMRTELTAMIAHDMRTPLHAILLQLDALQMKAGAESLPREALDRVQRNGKRLARMVEDLLDTARIENGRLHLEPETVLLHEAVPELVSQISPGLNGRSLLVEVQSGGPAVSVDLLRLQQVLTNLVENADKYSPAGAPIEVRVEPCDGGMRVAVRDHGAGIPPSQLPLVFERFYQLESRQKCKGLGLGLYICRGLVTAQRGRIWAESPIGQGSTFSVWFPAAETSD